MHAVQNNFAEAESSLFRPEVSVAPWFSPDVKTGSLCLHLETPSCFAAGRSSLQDDLALYATQPPLRQVI